MAKPEIVFIANERKKRAKKAPAKKPRRKPVSFDPRLNVEGRVFEIITENTEGEHGHAHRFRIRLLHKGGVSKNVAKFIPGGDEWLVGMVQELISAKKWSPPGYGGVPICTFVSIREILPEPEAAPEPTPLKKKDDEK